MRQPHVVQVTESVTHLPTEASPPEEMPLAEVVAPPLPGSRPLLPTIMAGARVVMKDRDLGTVALVLTDHTPQSAPQLVIRQSLFSSRRLIVPMDRIVDATLERILLDLRPDELAALPEYRADREIADDAERAIGDDEIVRRLSAPYLEIAVNNGVVTVTGNIATSAHRYRVEDSVRRVRGVRGLHNLPIGDDELESAVAQVLGHDPRTHRFIIPVHATLGLVRLSGNVPTIALDLARAVPGVRAVQIAEPAPRG